MKSTNLVYQELKFERNKEKYGARMLIPYRDIWEKMENNMSIKQLVKTEEAYSKAVIQYFRTVYESDLMKYKFIKNKVWRMKHQNPTEYRQACELIGVHSLFDKYQ